MQVELIHQLLLDRNLCIICSEEKTIRKDNSSPTILHQAIHDNAHKQVSCLGACQIRRKVILHVIFLGASIWRIHQHNVELIFLRIVQNILEQAVVVIYTRILNAMQEHISNAEHIAVGYAF